MLGDVCLPSDSLFFFASVLIRSGLLESEEEPDLPPTASENSSLDMVPKSKANPIPVALFFWLVPPILGAVLNLSSDLSLLFPSLDGLVEVIF